MDHAEQSTATTSPYPHTAHGRRTRPLAHDARTVLINGICHRALRCISRFMLYARFARFMLRFMLHTECAARLRPACGLAVRKRARRTCIIRGGVVHFYPSVPPSFSFSLFLFLCSALITSPCRCFVSDFFLLHSLDGDFMSRWRIVGFPWHIPFTCYLIPYSLWELCRCSLVLLAVAPDTMCVIPDFSSLANRSASRCSYNVEKNIKRVGA